ncbi:MAG: DUF5916 domain-containing protein [Kofleriaceae bacterium]|nr:DUF5916 domain-containing protein [Kofleriaceae bacterium]
MYLVVRLWVAAAIVLAALPAAPAHAQAKDKEKFVLVGLRPVGANGAGDLGRLVEAQGLRTVFQAVLQDVLGGPVLGHEQLAAVIGPKYLVAWFKCADDVACISQIIQPLLKSGYDTAITGDYTVTETGFRVHLTTFKITDHKIIKEVTFEATPNAGKDGESSWRSAAVKILANAKLRIRSNITGTTCLLDGKPCVFESDQQSIVVMPGEHTIELSKDNYDKATATVNVTADRVEDVSLALRSTTTVPPPGKEDGKGGAPVATPRPSLPAVRTTQKINLDGKLDDEAWSKAWLETNFVQKFPDETKEPTQRTEARVLYNNETLYIGVRCFDKEPKKIVAQLTRRDRDIPGDRISVDISSRNDRATAFHFQVSAAGVQVDGLWFNDTSYNNDWDGLWYSATTIDEQGWSAEIQIPLETLRYNGDVGSFGFQLRRYLGRRGEIDEWSYTPSTEQGEVSYYGTLADLNGLKAKRLLEVLLYDSRSVIRRTNQAFAGTTLTDRFGADMRLGVTPALTLDATVNPDFGNVEADQVILNLTTVEAYFPEKRRFFIEGSELFQTPLQMFYSRRLGANPPDQSIGALREQLPNGRIWGAAKLTGVLAGRLSIALLEAVTARQDAKIERADGTADEVLIDPMTNFAVLRLKQEFGTNSFIGLFATAVNRMEPRNEAAPLEGDGCPVPDATDFAVFAPPMPQKGRCTNDAYTGGVDTVLRTSDGKWRATAQVVGSYIRHGPTLTIPDGTLLGSGDAGFGATTAFGRYGGKRWLFEVQTRHLSPRLQLNDAGYLGAANMHEIKPSLTWRTTEPRGPFQAINVTASARHFHTFSGVFVSTDPYVDVMTTFKNLWTVGVTFEPYYPRWFEIRETLDGARTQRNHGFAYQGFFNSNPNKAVTLSGGGGVIHNYGGALDISSRATLSMRPTPTLELDIIGAGSVTLNSPRWFDTIRIDDDTRTYVFSELDSRVVDITLRGTYTFSKKLTLQGYVQAFLAAGNWSKPTENTVSGSRPTLYLDGFVPTSTASTLGYEVSDFDFRAGAINVNLFLRYEYQPMSAIWIVYTRDQRQRAYDPMEEGPGRLRFDRFSNGPATDVFLVKATYLWH